MRTQFQTESGRQKKFGQRLKTLFQCAFQNADYPNEEAFEKGVRLIALAAKEGRKHAFADAADLFLGGLGGKPDIDRALDILRTGVEAGDAYSCCKSTAADCTVLRKTL